LGPSGLGIGERATAIRRRDRRRRTAITERVLGERGSQATGELPVRGIARGAAAAQAAAPSRDAGAEDRRRAAAQAAVNARTHSLIELWQAMEELVAGTAEHDGRLFVRRGKKGCEVVVTGLRPIHPKLRGRPILHLDATLRP
jgi:hypothetical protein